MATPTITSVNAVYMLTIPGLYNSAQEIQQFSMDDLFSTDSIDTAELQMGSDGTLVGGFVFNPIKQSLTLLASSPSNDLFDNWYMAQRAARELYVATATVSLPAVGRIYTLTSGYLTGYAPMAAVKKVLQPRQYSITWGRIVPGVV